MIRLDMQVCSFAAFLYWKFSKAVALSLDSFYVRSIRDCQLVHIIEPTP